MCFSASSATCQSFNFLGSRSVILNISVETSSSSTDHTTSHQGVENGEFYTIPAIISSKDNELEKIIFPLHFTLKGKRPEPAPREGGIFWIFTRTSKIIPDRECVVRSTPIFRNLWMRHDQKYPAGKDRLNLTGAGPGK
jgi:hypothetical protein